MVQIHIKIDEKYILNSTKTSRTKLGVFSGNKTKYWKSHIKEDNRFFAKKRRKKRKKKEDNGLTDCETECFSMF